MSLIEKLKQRGKLSPSVMAAIIDEAQGVPLTDDQVWSARRDGSRQWTDNGAVPGFRVVDNPNNVINITINNKGTIIMPTTATPQNGIDVNLPIIAEGGMEFSIRFPQSTGFGSVGCVGRITPVNGGIIPDLAVGEYYENSNFLTTKNMIHCFTPDGTNWYVTGAMSVIQP